jgi:hypothetical protein
MHALAAQPVSAIWTEQWSALTTTTTEMTTIDGWV